MNKFLLLVGAACIAAAAMAQPVRLPVNIGFDEDPSNFVNMGGLTYFIAYNNNTGYELWKSDGSIAGTVLAVDIHPTGSSLFGSKLTVFNNLLYFFADNGTLGKELWKSDGTPAGTSLVKDIYPGTIGSTAAYGITASVDALYFFARDSAGTNRYGLWKSDGTTAGTIRLAITNNTNNFIAVDSNVVYFDGDFGGMGNELCKSDGTVGGTVLLKDINPGVLSSNPMGFAVLARNKLIFAAKGPNGTELYTSDGTTAGTVLLKDINIYGNSNGSPAGVSVFGNKALFFANDSLHGIEPWITDGTTAGTQLLMDINPGTGNSSNINSGNTPYFTEFNGKAYFSTSYNSAMWTTDGTTVGTVRFMTGMTTPSAVFKAHNGRLFFVGKATAQEIWSTANGVQSRQHTFFANPVITLPGFFPAYNVVFFVMKNAFGDKILYKLDLDVCPVKAKITGTKTLTCGNHSTTLSISGFNSYNWNTGDTTTQITASTPGTYIVSTYDTTLSCTSADTAVVTMLSTGLATPQLCGITVDSASGKNMLVWNKYSPKVAETHFRIEKEIGTNQYITLADVPYDSLSSYVDAASNPLVNSNRYRLLLLDSCGNISIAGTPHQTVHLTKNIGTGGEINLLWNAYMGTTYKQLNVLRSVNGAAWQNLGVLAGTATSYADLVPPTGSLRYQIEVLIDSTCTPSRALFSLLSNAVTVVTSGLAEAVPSGMKLSPNPVVDVLHIQLTENLQQGHIFLTDITGKLIGKVVVDGYKLVLPTDALASGMYIVQHSALLQKPLYFIKQ